MYTDISMTMSQVTELPCGLIRPHPSKDADLFWAVEVVGRKQKTLRWLVFLSMFLIQMHFHPPGKGVLPRYGEKRDCRLKDRVAIASSWGKLFHPFDRSNPNPNWQLQSYTRDFLSRSSFDMYTLWLMTSWETFGQLQHQSVEHRRTCRVATCTFRIYVVGIFLTLLRLRWCARIFQPAHWLILGQWLPNPKIQRRSERLFVVYATDWELKEHVFWLFFDVFWVCFCAIPQQSLRPSQSLQPLSMIMKYYECPIISPS